MALASRNVWDAVNPARTSVKAAVTFLVTVVAIKSKDLSTTSPSRMRAMAQMALIASMGILGRRETVRSISIILFRS